MKTIILILITIFFSCEALETNENIGSLDYHEYLGFAWQKFFGRDYSTAIEYFNTAKEIAVEDEEYMNSAEIGLGWTYLMLANVNIGNPTTVVSYRDQAYEKFQYDSLETEAISSYSENCQYSHCDSSSFIDDRNVGIIYHNAYEYFIDESITLDDTLTSKITNFIDSHLPNTDDDYNIKDGKPSDSEGYNFNLTTNSLIVLLAQLHLRNDDLDSVCNLLETHQLCNLDNSDCSNQMIPIIECLQTYSGF